MVILRSLLNHLSLRNRDTKSKKPGPQSSEILRWLLLDIPVLYLQRPHSSFCHITALEAFIWDNNKWCPLILCSSQCFSRIFHSVFLNLYSLFLDVLFFCISLYYTTLFQIELCASFQYYVQWRLCLILLFQIQKYLLEYMRS